MAQRSRDVFQVKCPKCGRQSPVARETVGLPMTCPGCQERFKAVPTIDKTPTQDTPPATAELPPTCDMGRPGGDGALPAKLAPGDKVGRYVIREWVGEGGFGDVYRAYDPELEREVALKIPKRGALTPPERERFLGDAKAASRLRHPHIVPVYDAGQFGDRLFIAMAFVDGETLHEALGKNKLERRHAGEIAQALAEALAYAHEQGIVHRDVKPQNVMLDGQGRPHLIDFGLARRQDLPDTAQSVLEAAEEKTPPRRKNAKETQAGALLGTYPYMSPEQAAGQGHEATQAMDQYGLGVTLYEMLCGHTPFEGPPQVLLYHAVHTPPPSPKQFVPDLPADLEAVVLKALSKRPEERYPSCGDMAEDLRRWLGGEFPKVRRPKLSERLWRWARREPALFTVSCIAATALLLALVLSILFGVEQARAAMEEQRLRKDAEEAHGTAREKEGKAIDAERIARQRQADLMFDKAQHLLGLAEIGQGMVWLGESLKLAEEAKYAALEHTCRTNLSGWRDRLHALTAVDGHKGTLVRSAAFLDKDRFVTAGENEGEPGGFVSFWDFKDAKPLPRMVRHDAPVTALAAEPAQGVLLVGCASGEVFLYDQPKAGDKVLCFKASGRVNALAFDPDAKARRFLVGCADGMAYLCTVDDKGTVSPRPLSDARDAGHSIQCVAFSPSGGAFLTAGADPLQKGVARLYRADQPKTPDLFRHPYAFRAAAFSPQDTGVLATGHGRFFRGFVLLWQVDETTIRQISEPLAHQGEVYSVEFSEDGELLASAGQDRAARLWHVDTHRPLGQPLRHPKDVPIARFRAGTRELVTACDEEAIRRWRIAGTPAPINTWSSTPVLAATMSGDGNYVVAGGRVLGGVAWVRPVDKGEAQRLGLPDTAEPVLAVDCDRSGNVIAVACGQEDERHGQAFLFKRAAPEKPWAVLDKGAAVTAIALRASTGGADTLVATGDLAGDIRLWRITDKGEAKLLHTISKKHKIYGLTFSPDGETLLAGSRDGYARLFDLKGEQLCEWPHPDSVLAVAFARDGEHIVTGYVGGAMIGRWHKRDGKHVIEQIGATLPHQAGILSVAFSRDGNQVLTGGTDGFTWLWDKTTCKPMSPPWQRDGVTVAVRFANAGNIMTAGTDQGLKGTVEFWQTPEPVDATTKETAAWITQVTGLGLKGGTIAAVDAAARGPAPAKAAALEAAFLKAADRAWRLDFGKGLPRIEALRKEAAPEVKMDPLPKTPIKDAKLPRKIEDNLGNCLGVGTINVAQLASTKIGREFLERIVPQVLPIDWKELGIDVAKHIDRIYYSLAANPDEDLCYVIGKLAVLRDKLKEKHTLKLNGRDWFMALAGDTLVLAASKPRLGAAFSDKAPPTRKEAKSFFTDVDKTEAAHTLRFAIWTKKADLRRFPVLGSELVAEEIKVLSGSMQVEEAKATAWLEVVFENEVFTDLVYRGLMDELPRLKSKLAEPGFPKLLVPALGAALDNLKLSPKRNVLAAQTEVDAKLLQTFLRDLEVPK